MDLSPFPSFLLNVVYFSKSASPLCQATRHSCALFECHDVRKRGEREKESRINISSLSRHKCQADAYTCTYTHRVVDRFEPEVKLENAAELSVFARPAG